VDVIKSELKVAMNYEMSCGDFYKYAKKQRPFKYWLC